MREIKVAQSEESSIKGQALTELAVFGSILLFCLAVLVQYGLQANYQQQLQMEAFRRAQKMAFERSGPNSAASLVLIKDKPFPDPRDQFGFAERNTVAAGEGVVWDTDQSAQYVKKFPANPLSAAEKAELEADLPATYFQIDKGNLANYNNAIPASKRPSVPAGQNDTFGFYTARFDKMPCPSVITVVLEDRTHNDPQNTQHTEYFPIKVRYDQIYVARMEGGFEEPKADPDSSLLMFPYFRRPGSLIKYKISDADLDGDGKLENIIAADKDKNLFYIKYHDNAQQQPQTVAGAIQVDTSYMQVEAEDKDPVTKFPLGPEKRQGMLQDLDKTLSHTESKIVKTEKTGVITSQTTLNAKQTTVHRFRLNGGQIVDIPVEVTVNQADLYNWSKK